MKLKLYYSPGACSLASHIALVEAKADFTLVKVDVKAHKIGNQNYYDINPKGSVPVLDLIDSGDRLTENVAILPFIADIHPNANLIASPGQMKRVHTEEWLGFIASEIHKAFKPYHDPGSSPEALEKAKQALSQKFAIVDEALRRSAYLVGPNVTVADFYLFVMETWVEKFKHPAAELTSVQRHMKALRARPSVQEALKQES